MGVGGQLHAPAALPPGKRPGTDCIEGWVGPRALLDGCDKSRPQRDFFPVKLFPFVHFCTFTSFRPSSCHLCSILVLIQQT
jgi:hypothetical protein